MASDSPDPTLAGGGAAAGGASAPLARRARRFRRVHHVVGGAIVLGWALMVGRIALDRARARASAPAEDVAALLAKSPADTRTYGVYQGDAKIGWAASRRVKTAEGWLFADQAIWQMTLQGTRQRLVATTQALVGDDFSLKSFQADVDAGAAHILAEGHVAAGGKHLAVTLDTAGRKIEQDEALDGPIVLAAMVRPSVAARAPAPGKSYSFELFNPIARGVETIEVVVKDRETLHTALGDIPCWRMDEILRGSIRTQVWIDDAGETVREVSPLGLRMEAEPREKAIALPDVSAAVPDLVMAVRVPVKGNLAAAVNGGHVRVRLGGIDPSEFPLLHGGRQRLEGDVLTVNATTVPVDYALPYVGGDFDAELASEPLVQASDPAIVAAARRIVRGEGNAVNASRRINAWVHDTLVKENSAGVPSAVEVLQTKRGDCNEHATLFVALARAVGIPARIAVGVVWANARGAGPGLYYHAWPEVYLGPVGVAMPGTTAAEQASGWYAVDPTLGQFPADAGHFRFLVGGLERQVDLLKLIGHLDVEVLP